jgi:hypothetical protein
MDFLVVAAHLVHRMLFLIQPMAALRVLAFLYWLLHYIPAVQAAHAQKNMPARCCTRIVDEFMPSYASVLVYGSDPIKLEQAVREAESQQRITSCFTAWCPNCASPYLLTTDLAGFPSPSAHHTHQLVLLSVLRDSGALVPSEPV